ncbi:MAG: hypothetical protein ACQEUD_16235 [Bacillota bacterium]|jgi:hypothetical protein
MEKLHPEGVQLFYALIRPTRIPHPQCQPKCRKIFTLPAIKEIH